MAICATIKEGMRRGKLRRMDPFTFTIHDFKALKEAAFAAILSEVLFLGIFGPVVLMLVTRPSRWILCLPIPGNRDGGQQR